MKTLSIESHTGEVTNSAVYGIDDKERILDEVAKMLSHVYRMADDSVVGPEVREMIETAEKLDADWGHPFAARGYYGNE